jgi:hypothetical protein
MIFCSCKYLISKHHKAMAVLAVLLTVTGAAGAQLKNPVAANDPLYFYNSTKVEKPARSYTKLDYARPNNQLMSWLNYPLTATQVEQRMNQNARDNKFSNKVAKDIITAVFSKKKPAAVIPKF